MQLITVNSPEHRDLKTEALINNLVHILHQLTDLKQTGHTHIRLIANFFDALMYTSYATEEMQEKEYVMITGKEFYDATCRIHVD